jgi:transcriptional regulator with XRE-family HTH domain
MTFFRLTPDERVVLGDRLRLARHLAKLTVRAVASEFDVSTNTVNNWEHGGLPADELRPRIAALYGVEENVLFAEYEARVDAARALLKPA